MSTLMTHSRSKSVDLYSILHGRVEKPESFVYNLRARHGDGSSKRFLAYLIDMLRKRRRTSRFRFIQESVTFSCAVSFAQTP